MRGRGGGCQTLTETTSPDRHERVQQRAVVRLVCDGNTDERLGDACFLKILKEIDWRVCFIMMTCNGRWTTVSMSNDNDTLKEVPHLSDEGPALQARVSRPWPHKKESVLLVELARWQGVQTQTVNGQIAMQQVSR